MHTLLKNICFDIKTLELLDKMAELKGKTRSAVVRELVEEKARELGLSPEEEGY